MHVWSLLFGQSIGLNDQNIVINTNLQQANTDPVPQVTLTKTVVRHATATEKQTEMRTQTVTALATPTTKALPVLPFDNLPHTELLAHAPGWTLFRNLYMADGTLFIVADEEERKAFPEIRMMTSTGLEAENTEENIAMREPTDKNMRIISPEEARRRWVYPATGKEKALNRVWTVEGNTVSFTSSLFLYTLCFLHLITAQG